MSFERWELVQRLVEDTQARPVEARRAYLESACDGDTELRDEALSLLGAPAIDSLPAEWLITLATEVPNRFVPGQVVAGRYLIRELLGRGGLGEVYEAEDQELAITVALKTLRVANVSPTELKLEGMLARAVWHPNVCRVYDLGCHGEGVGVVWFLTMELLRGKTLAELLRCDGRLSLDRAFPIAKDMAAGLGAAHAAGVVHRDFKPGNVILVGADGQEQAVMTDFGTARAAENEPGQSALSGLGTIAGTPAYMAPEQVLGESLGPAADVYALGIVLYEMVTGALPFTADSALELARRRLGQDPPSPRSVMPDLDERWDAVIRRCMSRDPSRRFGRAEDVADALEGRMPVEIAQRTELIALGRNTLPSERDPLVGRQADIEALGRNLASRSRLVTLLGAGGIGKTRLAVHFGWRALSASPGGVWFCDLRESGSLNGISTAVATSLGAQLARSQPIDQLGHAIAGRGRCLLILDNFEQAAGHAAATVGRWLEQAPEARFVVTSRERLGMAQECVQEVGPLSTEAGLELFSARARGLRPALALEGAEGEAAREIVRLVDGMPLAIELAAARMRVMSAVEIVSKMRKRFQLLTGGRASHHETLEGVIDGSWELLDPWERTAWLECSVFEGGFTLGAAEAVLDRSSWPGERSVVDAIQALMDKSLVRVASPGTGPGPPELRFGMYLGLQVYARKKLGSESAIPVEQRHGAWYARYGDDEAIERLDGRGGAERWRRLESELDNMVAACRQAGARGDGPTMSATFRAAWAVLKLRGPFGAAVELGRDVLSRCGIERADRGSVLHALGEAELLAGMHDDACTHLDAALAIAREQGDPRSEGRILSSLGNSWYQQHHFDEARPFLASALEVAREGDDRRTESSVLNILGHIDHGSGRIDEARSRYEAALAVARSSVDRRAEGVTLGNLGIVQQNLGRADEALALYEASLAIHAEVGNLRSEAITRNNIGSLMTDLGRVTEARRHLEAALSIARTTGARNTEGIALTAFGELLIHQEAAGEARACLETALVIARDLGDKGLEGIVIDNLGRLLHSEGKFEEARVHYETALALHREAGDQRYGGAVLTALASLLHQQGARDAARDTLSEAESMLREIDAKFEIGKLLCARAEMEWQEGDAAAASRNMDLARSIAVQVGAGSESSLGRALARVRRMLGAAD